MITVQHALKRLGLFEISRNWIEVKLEKLNFNNNIRDSQTDTDSVKIN